MKRKIIALLIAVMTLASAIAYAEPVTSSATIDKNDADALYQFYLDVMDYTELWYFQDVKSEDLMKQTIKELIKEDPTIINDLISKAYTALDENSHFITEEEFVSISSQTFGEFSGVGIYLFSDEGKVIINAPIKGGPAFRADIKTGDVITKVDDTETKGLSLNKVSDMIKGPTGSKVKLGIQRGNESLTFELTRENIKINPIEYKVLEDNVGYIKIDSFNLNTVDFFKEAYDALKKEGVDRIVLDVRDNLGGIVDEAVEIADYFLPKDALITTVVTNIGEDTHKAKADGDGTKVVVLVNKMSASASEILASAIMDNDGILVGEQTYGKGTVQNVMPTKQGGVLWLTYAQYRTPSGNFLHKKGITPNFIIENETEKVDTSKFIPLTFENKFKVGDKGEQVKAIKQRLEALGIGLTEVDDVYDEFTASLIKGVQAISDLYAYGVADIATQKALDELLQTKEKVVDKQLEKAVELIKRMK